MAVLMAKGQRATSQARGLWAEVGVSGGGPVSALTVSLQNPFLWERILLLSRKWNYVSLRYGKTTMTLNFILKELNNDGKN